MMNRKQKTQVLEALHTAAEYFDNGGNDLTSIPLVIDMLSACDDTCRNGFSEGHYEKYSDTFQSLKQVLAGTDWETMQEADRRQSFELCSQIVMATVARLEQDSVDIKKEIVFLPYKASMWYCMESLWKAACKDPEHCNAYVIPIPYCNFTPEHKIDQWHCERNQFPAYVPTLDWQQVDLAALKPDIVVIHNPYDDYNKVTSVDSRYYSRNLRKIAGKIIYIPYYMSGNTLGKTIAQMPGAVNADYIIVQSEWIKKQYEMYYPGEKIPRGKIVALGSPTVDKIVSLKKNDLAIPAAWQKIIGNRKVVLYNTSLSAWLKNPEMLLPKLRFVLETFRNKKDLAFWWRPHPLMKDTLKSMHPSLYDEYCQLEQDYIRAAWGIYDNTADMHRAIAWGDCYYGDESGVMWAYMVTGKPIVEQDMTYVAAREPLDISLWSQAFCRCGDVLWMIHGALGALFRYDIQTEELEFVTEVDRELFGFRQYIGMECSHNRLYIITDTRKNIILYDLEQKELHELAIPLADEYDRVSKFARSIQLGDSIYCIPTKQYPFLLCIDGGSTQIAWQLDLQAAKEKLGLSPKAFICDAAVYEDRYLVCLINNSNKLLVIDTVKRCYNGITMGNRIYSSLAVLKDRIYLGSSADKMIDCFSLRDNVLLYNIADPLSSVQSLDDSRLLMDDKYCSDWRIADDAGNVLHYEANKAVDRSSLRDNFFRVFGKYKQNVLFDTCSARLHVLDKALSINLNLKNAKGLDLDLFDKQQYYKEFPGINIEKIMAKQPDKVQTQYNIGEKIYDFLNAVVK